MERNINWDIYIELGSDLIAQFSKILKIPTEIIETILRDTVCTERYGLENIYRYFNYTGDFNALEACCIIMACEQKDIQKTVKTVCELARYIDIIADNLSVEMPLEDALEVWKTACDKDKIEFQRDLLRMRNGDFWIVKIEPKAWK